MYGDDWTWAVYLYSLMQKVVKVTFPFQKVVFLEIILHDKMMMSCQMNIISVLWLIINDCYTDYIHLQTLNKKYENILILLKKLT